MFADSLPDSGWRGHSSRGWSTLISFAAQAVAVGSLLVIPLIYTARLPQLARIEPTLVPAALHAPSENHPPANRPRTNTTAGNESVERAFVVPREIPRAIAMDRGPAGPLRPDFDDPILSGPGDRGVRLSLGSNFNVAILPPPVAERKLRVSRIMEGNLISRVQPEYPALAKLAHIQGSVAMHAVISKEGTIENLEATSGPPLLIKAAIEAVRQWRYRPYLLNGEPVEVDTQITVNFVLSGG